MWRKLLLLCGGVIGLISCGDDGRCQSLERELLALLRTGCPDSSPACGGNPNLDRPVAPFSQVH
jgi:hypothetical protein